MKTAPEKRCPSCAELIKADGSVCQFCKSELPPVQPKEPLWQIVMYRCLMIGLIGFIVLFVGFFILVSMRLSHGS